MHWKTVVKVALAVIGFAWSAYSAASQAQSFGLEPRWNILIGVVVFAGSLIWGWYSTHQELQESKDADYRNHCDKLLKFLEEVGRIEAVEYDERHLLQWWERPVEDYCSIPKGKAFRDNNETVVRLDMETTEEWDCLKQHLKGGPLLDIFESWKTAMSQDLTARKALFDAITKAIEQTQSIPTILSPTEPKEEEPYISYGYVDRLYHQVLCQKIGIRCRQMDEGSFQDTKEGKVRLSGDVVAYSDDAAQREDTVKFFLKAQKTMLGLCEAEEAREAYQKAQSETDRLNSEKDKVLIAGKLPLKSRCNLCR